MNRALLCSGLALAGFGIVAVALDAQMLAGPRGAPLLVSAPGSATLQPANFDGTCGPALLFSGKAGEYDGPDAAGSARIVGVTVRGSVVVGLDGADTSPMLLVFDSADNLLGAGTPAEILPMLPDLTAPCGAPAPKRVVAPI